MTGYNRPISSLRVGDKQAISDALKCHFMLKGVLAEINEFAEGLKALGVLDYIRKFPDLMREMFVDENPPLTARKLLFLCIVLFTLVHYPYMYMYFRKCQAVANCGLFPKRT